MTLAYAAPELLSRGNIVTHTDVYAPDCSTRPAGDPREPEMRSFQASPRNLNKTLSSRPAVSIEENESCSANSFCSLCSPLSVAPG